MALVENNSILMSIKKLLNVEHDETAFDMDIGTFINAQFLTLHQLGIGPENGFVVRDADVKWTDFSTDPFIVEAVKEYVFLKVRMVFDPPASSIVSDAYNSQISELEWRMHLQSEKSWDKPSGIETSETENQNEEAGEP